MPGTMQALVIESPGRARIVEAPCPTPKDDEVIIQVQAAGLCGTDLHIFRGEFPAIYPLIPGHEFSGIVVERGTAVGSLNIGEAVTADPNIACGECYFCRRAQFNHCLNHAAVGVTRNGAFAEYVPVPARNIYALGEGLSFQEAAMVEPRSCVVYGLERLKMSVGSSILIFGAGPIGLLLLQGCLHSGASMVVVADLREKRLEDALALGATHVVKADENAPIALRGLAPYGYDVVIDATGDPNVVENAPQWVISGGTLLIFGVSPEEAKIPISPFDIYRRDLRILGTFALCTSFEPALEWIRRRVVKVEPLIHPVVTLNELPIILEGGLGADAGKVLVKMN